MSSEFSRCCIYEVRTHFLQEASKDPELQRVLMSCSCVEFLESKASGAKVPWLAHEMAKPSSAARHASAETDCKRSHRLTLIFCTGPATAISLANHHCSPTIAKFDLPCTR